MVNIKALGKVWLYSTESSKKDSALHLARAEACTAKKMSYMYTFSGNSAASVPISTFKCLWVIYIFPGSVFVFPEGEKEGRSWEYINRSQAHECGNWDCVRAIPYLGILIPLLRIFVSDFRYCFFAVCMVPWRYRYKVPNNIKFFITNFLITLSS